MVVSIPVIDFSRGMLKNTRADNKSDFPTVEVGKDHGLWFYHTGLEEFFGWTGSEWKSFNTEGTPDGNNYVTDLVFNSTSGDLTLSRVDLDPIVTNLDGRYIRDNDPYIAYTNKPNNFSVLQYMDKGLTVPDATSILLGDLFSLRLYHSAGSASTSASSTNSFIDNNLGDLFIRQQDPQGSTILTAINESVTESVKMQAVIAARSHPTAPYATLYCGDNWRLQTTILGAIVQGELHADAFVGDGSRLTGIPDTKVTGMTWSSGTKTLTLTQNNEPNLSVNIGTTGGVSFTTETILTAPLTVNFDVLAARSRTDVPVFTTITIECIAQDAVLDRVFEVGDSIPVPFHHRQENHDMADTMIQHKTDGTVRISFTKIYVYGNSVVYGTNGDEIDYSKWKMRVVSFYLADESPLPIP